MSHTITVKGFDAVIEVTDFTPSQPAYTSGLPEDCYPAEEGELVWEAATGNDLLNEYINEDEKSFDDINEQLEVLILKEMEDDRY